MARQIFNKTATERAKHKFGFDPNDATDIPKLVGDDVLVELQDSSELLQKINFSTEIKNSGKVPVMRGDFPLNEWDDCDMTEDGTITFQEVPITTSPLGFSEPFCSRTLVPKWTAMALRSGLLNEMKEMPFETQAQALALASLRASIENILINGDTLSPDSNLVHFDGWAKIMKASATAGGPEDTQHVTPATISASNAYDEFKKVSRSFPDKVKESTKTLVILCNGAMFNHLVDNLEANNNFHYSASVRGEGVGRELDLPSEGITVRVVRGLADNVLLGLAYENIVVGTDATEDMATIEVVPLVESRKIRLDAGVYIGTNLAFKEESVYYGAL